MAEWDISGVATLPPEADDMVVRYIDPFNSGGFASVGMAGNFNFTYDDANGLEFFLIFELLDDGSPVPGAQPIIHGPYDASVVGSPLGEL